MWSAIKSDLFEFVNTLQQDTSSTLNHVLGEEEEENILEEQEVVLQKLRVSVRRAYETYANPLKDTRQREFDRFKKKFSLISHSKEIAVALDEEPEVSRYYAELVPTQITPEEFWARLFFRLYLLNRSGTATFEDDDFDEEELVWDEEIPASEANDDLAVEFHQRNAQTVADNSKELEQCRLRIRELEAENDKLRSQVKSLVSRVGQLETDLKAKASPVPTLRTPLASADPSTRPNSASLESDVDVSSPHLVHVSTASIPQRDSSSWTELSNNGSKADTGSVSSESSGVIVTRESTSISLASLAEDPVKLPHLPGHNVSNSVNSGSDGPKQPAYLASLDDDDEEDGWN